MSYANVAAANAPPPDKQPRPDHALLNTTPPSANNIADDGAKVNVVASNFRESPATLTSEARPPPDYDGHSPDPSPDDKPKHNRRQTARQEGLDLWAITKHYLLRPGVAGGLVGLINVGLLATAGRAFYTQPHLRRDASFIASTVTATIALLSVEGYAVEKLSEDSSSRTDKAHARDKAASLSAYIYQRVLRPTVLVNTALLGSLGYYSYINWDRPSWNKRTVSTITAGLIAFWGTEGLFASWYNNDRQN